MPDNSLPLSSQSLSSNDTPFSPTSGNGSAPFGNKSRFAGSAPLKPVSPFGQGSRFSSSQVGVAPAKPPVFTPSSVSFGTPANVLASAPVSTPASEPKKDEEDALAALDRLLAEARAAQPTKSFKDEPKKEEQKWMSPVSPVAADDFSDQVTTKVDNNDKFEVDEVEESEDDAPAMTQSATPVDSVVGSPLVDQSLESQNIFDLLGVSDGKAEEKEEFLDQLQEVIWEDFIEHDTPLILTAAEKSSLDAIAAEGKTPEVQEKMLVFLEKLIPDLEAMMMDKALELKEDMVSERIAGMREFYAQDAAKLKQIHEVEQLIEAGKWADASVLLNSIK